MPWWWWVGVTGSSWLFCSSVQKMFVRQMSLKACISQDSIFSISDAILWVPKCVRLFLVIVHFWKLNSNLWKCSSRPGQVPDVTCSQSVVGGRWWPYWSGNPIVGNKINGNGGFEWEKREEKFFFLWGMSVAGDRETGAVRTLGCGRANQSSRFENWVRSGWWSEVCPWEGKT